LREKIGQSSLLSECKEKEVDHLQGQLRPSKSIGGFRVYGLAGRLAVGVSAAAWSLGSRGGSLREILAKGSWSGIPVSSALVEEEEYFVALL
jgi:hypothetical protein